MDQKKKSFEELLAEAHPAEETAEESLGFEMYGLSEEMDREILLHRDAHFGGSFDVMLEYYRSGGSGVQDAFELERIEQLATYEKEHEIELAPLLLTGADAEKVSAARLAYQKLREICEIEQEKKTVPLLIAELILSEVEGVDEEVAALVAEGKHAIPALLDLLRSSEFHDPLFPGYGKAPYLAGKALGALGEGRALFDLFQEVGSEDFESEQMIVHAIAQLGSKALDFLLPILESTPYGRENEHAALCLGHFVSEERLQECAVKMLSDEMLFSHPQLASFVILSLEELEGSQRAAARELLDQAPLTEELTQDYRALLSAWK